MNTIENINIFIEDLGLIDKNIPIYDNYSYADAFLGITSDYRAIYDYNYMVRFLAIEFASDELNVSDVKYSEEIISSYYNEAIEFIDYNTLSAHIQREPVVLFAMEYNGEDSVEEIAENYGYDLEDADGILDDCYASAFLGFSQNSVAVYDGEILKNLGFNENDNVKSIILLNKFVMKNKDVA